MILTGKTPQITAVTLDGCQLSKKLCTELAGGNLFLGVTNLMEGCRWTSNTTTPHHHATTSPFLTSAKFCYLRSGFCKTLLGDCLIFVIIFMVTSKRSRAAWNRDWSQAVWKTWCGVSDSDLLFTYRDLPVRTSRLRFVTVCPRLLLVACHLRLRERRDSNPVRYIEPCRFCDCFRTWHPHRRCCATPM
jgi:hypothetical protein